MRSVKHDLNTCRVSTCACMETDPSQHIIVAQSPREGCSAAQPHSHRLPNTAAQEDVLKKTALLSGMICWVYFSHLNAN